MPEGLPVAACLFSVVVILLVFLRRRGLLYVSFDFFRESSLHSRAGVVDSSIRSIIASTCCISVGMSLSVLGDGKLMNGTRDPFSSGVPPPANTLHSEICAVVL